MDDVKFSYDDWCFIGGMLLHVAENTCDNGPVGKKCREVAPKIDFMIRKTKGEEEDDK